MYVKKLMNKQSTIHICIEMYKTLTLIFVEQRFWSIFCFFRSCVALLALLCRCCCCCCYFNSTHRERPWINPIQYTKFARLKLCMCTVCADTGFFVLDFVYLLLWLFYMLLLIFFSLDFLLFIVCVFFCCCCSSSGSL